MGWIGANRLRGTEPCFRSLGGASARLTRLEPFICSPEDRGECLSLRGRQSAVGLEVQSTASTSSAKTRDLGGAAPVPGVRRADDDGVGGRLKPVRPAR